MEYQTREQEAINRLTELYKRRTQLTKNVEKYDEIDYDSIKAELFVVESLIKKIENNIEKYL